jgi:hypothetical protein
MVNGKNGEAKKIDGKQAWSHGSILVYKIKNE